MENTGTPPVQWHIEEDRESLAERLAGHMAGWLQADLTSRDRTAMALSGGSTPALLYQALARQPLPWERIDVMPVDERWVAADSDQANERLIRQTLLQGGACDARFFSLLGDASAPHQQAALNENRLAACAWPLSVAVMGMGGDGHTASWFPRDPGLAEALEGDSPRLCVATEAPENPRQRLTLTWPVIRQAGQCVLLIHGEEKKRRLQQVLDTPGEVHDEPVRQLLRRPLSIYWSE